MSETRYLPGSPRLFNDHSVCTECGAMVDNEFLTHHEASHGRETDLTFAFQLQREANEYREENLRLARLDYALPPKKERRGFWPFR